MQTSMPSVNEIVLALQQQQPETAERLATKYLQGAPADEDVLLLLGLSLQSQQRREETVEVFRKLTLLQPQSVLHWNNFGTVLREAGQPEQAEAAYRSALAIDPADSAVLENLGLLFYDRADYAAARVCLIGACNANSELINARIYGASACCECTDVPGAERLVAAWWRWTALNLDQVLLLASVMARTAHADTAETILLRALNQESDKTRVRVRLLMLYERLNRVAEAQALLQQLPRPEDVADAGLQEEIINAFAALASRENDFAKARDLLEPLAHTGNPGSDFYFALARVREKLGDADGAMDALGRAHARQMEKAALMIPELIASGAEPLTTGLEPVNTQSRQLWPEIPAPSAADSPIYIMGFPRSGTTMLEQMLDAVPGLRAMDEQPFLQSVVEKMREFGMDYPRDLHRLDAQQAEQLRKTYWQLVHTTVRLAPGERLVDKNPLNMLRLPLVNRLYPDARIIFALRHPCDVVLSCYMQSFGAPAFMLLCSTLERLAQGYANAMQRWLQNVEVLSPQIMYLRHEDLLADFAGTARALGDFIGVDDAEPMLAFHEHARGKGYIATPSYAQVIEPVNRKGVDRWRRYRRYMEPILPILQPIMEHWGYAD